MSPMLEVRGLQKSFGGLRVTDNVDLVLNPGARTALIGPNGAGKTTLINLITGMLSPDSGTIRLAGEDISRLPAMGRAKHGLIRTFQVTRLFMPMTVADNLRIPVLHRMGKEYGARWTAHVRDEVEAEIIRVLHELGLADRAGTRADRLAYGEQRLVELGIALLMKPRVLLLDEPAAGVPQSESHIIMSAIDRLPADLAVVFIEHDMDLVFRFAREIVVLIQGAVSATGTPAEIAADEKVRAVYFGEHQP
ncbi:MAG: ABC transporter ATP-binding protein [Paracoccus denitrificans]|uniref:ABC transporter ATP-binding protein n=1 Tax=Paracoccus denitrificans TaxID=266 RepID=A0A533I243_PARDE|nr:MAG: ABC transporter ATP-binding protein [Paracoccus denitrificans]